MREHHKIAIDRLIESIEKDKSILALIINGSVVKGMEREDSDIDIILVATDKDFSKRKRLNTFYYHEEKFCDYPGVFIHGKVVDIEFLETVAERGSEPARYAFKDVHIAFSKVPKIKDLLEKIPVFQKEEKLEKIGKFYAQIEYANYIIKDAEKRNDQYLLTREINDLILFGGRLILEHNEILYPYHKFLTQVLQNAPDKPDNLMELINTLLKNRNSKNAQTLFEAIINYRKWETREFWTTRFIKDTEWAWIEGKPYVGDL